MKNFQNAVFILLTSNCQLTCETELNVARTRLIITILLCLHLNRSTSICMHPALYEYTGRKDIANAEKKGVQVHWMTVICQICSTQRHLIENSRNYRRLIEICRAKKKYRGDGHLTCNTQSIPPNEQLITRKSKETKMGKCTRAYIGLDTSLFK